MTDSKYADKFLQARGYTPGRASKVRLVVIHDMEAPEATTTAENIAAYFAGPRAPQASAHYNVDNDSIVQSVHETDTAWHAPGMNADGIGVEHAGYARQTTAEWQDTYSTAMLQRSARLVADICQRYGIPARHLTNDELRAGKPGIVGHYQGSQVYRGTHTDPGPGFPWDWYIAQVDAILNPPAPVKQPGVVGTPAKPKPLPGKVTVDSFDGVLGPNTIRAWQQNYVNAKRLTTADGVISKPSQLVTQVQRDLIRLGYLPKGSDDGMLGPKTQAALTKKFGAKDWKGCIQALQFQLYGMGLLR